MYEDICLIIKSGMLSKTADLEFNFYFIIFDILFVITGEKNNDLFVNFVNNKFSLTEALGCWVVGWL